MLVSSGRCQGRTRDQQDHGHAKSVLGLGLGLGLGLCLGSECMGQGAPATSENMATPKVAEVMMISRRMSRLRLLSSSMLMYSSVSFMYSPAPQAAQKSDVPSEGRLILLLFLTVLRLGTPLCRGHLLAWSPAARWVVPECPFAVSALQMDLPTTVLQLSSSRLWMCRSPKWLDLSSILTNSPTGCLVLTHLYTPFS